jgi:hypothetical protein
MKKGMILVAKDPCFMEMSNVCALTVGKEYRVVDCDKRDFCVIDDQKVRHWFSFYLWNTFFDIPESEPFQEFFSFMHQTHGIILTNGEMWDILHEIEKLQEKMKS